MIRASLEDVVIEPQRQALIPGFQDVRAARWRRARSAARSPAPGPTMFAWAREAMRRRCCAAMRREFARAVASQPTTGSSTMQSTGARVIAMSVA